MKENLLSRLRKYDTQYPKDIAAIDPELSKIVKTSGGSVDTAISHKYPEEYSKIKNLFVQQNTEDIYETAESNIHLKTVLTHNTTTVDYLMNMFDEYISAKKDRKKEVEQKYSSVNEIIRIEDITVNKEFTTNAFNEQTKWNIRLKNCYRNGLNYTHKFDSLSFPLTLTSLFAITGSVLCTGILLADSLTTSEMFNTTQDIANFAKGTLYSGHIGAASGGIAYKLLNSKHTKQAEAMNIVMNQADNLDNYLNRYVRSKK